MCCDFSECVPSSLVSSYSCQTRKYEQVPYAMPFPFMPPIPSRQPLQVFRGSFLRVHPLCSPPSRELTLPWRSLRNRLMCGGQHGRLPLHAALRTPCRGSLPCCPMLLWY